MPDEPRSRIGRSLPAGDSSAKAKGLTRFLEDITLPGMLHAKMVFPGRPHALVKRVSLARALSVSGVAAIATAESVPGRNRVGVVMDDQPLFAGERVRYEADCVAIVAADCLEVAESAASLVDIDYEDLPPVLTIDQARSGSAPHIHDEGNLAVEHTVATGDVAKGESESAWVVEEVLWSPVQEHAYMETLGALAIPSADGSMEMHVPSQCPFYVRDAVARCLGILQSQVRVLQLPIGGGFGGKEDVPSELSARVAVLAAITGRPVKIVLTREEDVAYSSKRHPMQLSYRMGCGRDGRIKFADIEIRADVGAYATLSPIVLFRSAVHAAGPYEIPNVRIKAYGFYTNSPPKGAMRGFGTPQVAFACESMIDHLARCAGIDPLEMRLRNALKAGSRTASGQVLDESVGFGETLARAGSLLGSHSDRFKPRKVGKDVIRARGIASMFYGVSLGAIGRALDRGTAKVGITADGSVSVFIGCTDMGQGAHAVIAQIAAEALGIEPDNVTVNLVDTDAVADSGPTVASRTTVMSGNAVLDACAKIKAQILEVASSVLGGPAVYDRTGSLIINPRTGRGVAPADMIRECSSRGLDLTATGLYVPPECSVDRQTGQGKAYYVYSFATDIAEVEVDTATGKVEVTGLTAIHDSGRIINPLTASSQVEGGVAQGIGLALREKYRVEGGRVSSGDLSTYLVPTALDVCDNMRVEFIECLSPDGPYGAKGLGEPAIIPVAAAIANAVSNALDVRVTALPIEPDWIVTSRQSLGR